MARKMITRSIAVSTDVYANLWAHRLPGEETENDILKRLLGVVSSHATSTADVKGKKMLWRDDVREALSRLGGSAPLASIYRAVREARRTTGRKIPTSIDAIVRRELEYNSSDSESWTERRDWFRSVHGLGAGVWALR